MLILSCRVWLHLRLPVTHSPSPSRLYPCPNGKDCYLCRKPDKGKRDTPGLQTWAPSGVGFQPNVAALVYQEERSGKEERSYLTHFPKMSAPLRGNPVTMNRWNDVFFSWKWKIRECRHVWQALTELLSLNGCFHNSLFQGLRVVQCTLVLKVWINPPAKTWWWERRWCWPKWCCCHVLHNYNRFIELFLPHFMMAGLSHHKCSASVGSSEIKLICIDPLKKYVNNIIMKLFWADESRKTGMLL